MSAAFERPPDDAAAGDARSVAALLAPGGLRSSATHDAPFEAATETAPTVEAAIEAATGIAPESSMLGALPLGARLVLRCRKDWRTATIVRIELDQITLSVSSPTGRTYRMRRPPDAPLAFDGGVPLLGAQGQWRTTLARYDTRW